MTKRSTTKQRQGRPKPNRPFGQFIKRLVANAQITPTQVAEHCKVSRGAVSNWFETGSITKMNLVNLAERLGTTVESIMVAYNATQGVPAPNPLAKGRVTEAQVAQAMALASTEHKLQSHDPKCQMAAWICGQIMTEELKDEFLRIGMQLAAGNRRLRVVAIDEPAEELEQAEVTSAPSPSVAASPARAKTRTSAPPKSKRGQKSKL